MRGFIKSKITNLIMLIMLGGVFLQGCGSHPNNATVTNRTGSAIMQDAEVEKSGVSKDATSETSADIYIVEALDMTDETIALYQVSTGKQLRYKYNMTTRFLDKYGKTSTWEEFTVGSVVNIGGLLPASGALELVQKSKDVWVYDGVSKFRIDEVKHLIEINGSNYKLTDSTKVYSDTEKILPSLIGKGDVITVIGQDKKIISIAVTTGHGYIQLKNTDLFDGSMIFIGNKIVSIVGKDKMIEVPEGDYKVTVANDGWGGSGDYTVVRDQITPISLGDLKGAGPSFCLITFLVTVPDTYVYIDGKEVDVTEPQKVQYGQHKLVVKCQGYASWNKILVVNSESATITLVMESEDSNTSDEDDANATEEPQQTEQSENMQQDSNSNTNANANTDDDTSSESNSIRNRPPNSTPDDNSSRREDETAGSSIKQGYDYETDYLSTISNLLSNLAD